MDSLPKLNKSEVLGKKVLVRVDVDIPPSDEIVENELYRLEAIIPTLRFLFEAECEIILIGHRGRPKGEFDKSLSLEPVSNALEKLLVKKWGEADVKALNMRMMENLRFDPGEEANNEHYAKHLSENGEFFVNEAFASSHREHASIVGLPKIIPHAAGLRFQKEVENLLEIRDGAKKPFVTIVSGVKEDKLEYARKLVDIADKILIAGRLPDLLKDDDPIHKNNKFLVGHLLPDKEDITIHTIEAFEKEVTTAGTIYVAGPLGKFEEEGHRLGTKRVFEKIAGSSGHKVAGGGDTIMALKLLGISEKFDWVSVGGGASLELLVKGTLPGIEALLS